MKKVKSANCAHATIRSPARLCRSGENSRPFTIASFEEEDKDAEMDEQEDCASQESQETSDYHSATSSDYGSASPSDTEEAVKDEEEEDGKEPTNKEPEVDTCTITMVPRIRKWPRSRANKSKYGRNMVILFCQMFCFSVAIIQPSQTNYFTAFTPFLY